MEPVNTTIKPPNQNRINIIEEGPFATTIHCQRNEQQHKSEQIKLRKIILNAEK